MKNRIAIAAALLSSVAGAIAVTAPTASASTPQSKCATKGSLEELVARRRAGFSRVDAKFLASEAALSQLVASEAGEAAIVRARIVAERDAVKAERSFHGVWNSNGRLEALDALCR